MTRWKRTLATAGAAAVLAAAALVTTAAIAADRSAATPRPAVGLCSMHTEDMEALHDAMGGDEMHDWMHDGDTMNGAGMMGRGGMMNGVAPR